MRDTSAINPLEQWRTHMLDGDFEAAWRISDVVRPSVWDGSPIARRSVRVECRHGLGDTILFARYFALLAKVAGRVCINPQPELRRLLSHIPGVEIANGAADAVLECTELAYVFRTTLDTIPAAVPYIHLPHRPPARHGGPLRVGLVWSSGAYNPLRSAGLRQLQPLASVPGICWTPLQHGPAFAEAALCGRDFGFHDAPDPTGGDALDTALRMIHLDLVVTPDTMAAHLAGALAIPTWTLLPYEADWRWLRDRDDSPWYPTMRLFRQRRPGDWSDPVARAAAALRNAQSDRDLS